MNREIFILHLKCYLWREFRGLFLPSTNFLVKNNSFLWQIFSFHSLHFIWFLSHSFTLLKNVASFFQLAYHKWWKDVNSNYDDVHKMLVLKNSISKISDFSFQIKFSPQVWWGRVSWRRKLMQIHWNFLKTAFSFKTFQAIKFSVFRAELFFGHFFSFQKFKIWQTFNLFEWTRTQHTFFGLCWQPLLLCFYFRLKQN